MNKTGVPLTGNPIQENPALKGLKVKLTAFAMFDISESIATEGDIVNLTGLQSWLFAGAGYAYQAQKNKNVFWLTSHSIKRLEVTIFENKNWKVTKYSDLNSGWIIGETRSGRPIGDNWIKYSDGSFGFDFPELLPEYIKKIVRRV